MRLNKKGQEMETQQVILYVLFSMVVLVFGVIMIQQFAESINVQTTFYTQNLEYKLLSARILNSANCLAWEQSMGSKAIVRAGIIDMQKFKGIFDEQKLNPERIKKCIGSDDFYIVALDVNGTRLDEYGKIELIGSNPPDKKNIFTDTYITQFYTNPEITTGRLEIWLKIPVS